MQRRLRLPRPDDTAIHAAFAGLREELDVSFEFPGPVLADAAEAGRAPRLPAVDETHIPYLTIDPPESRDLDQAMHFERRGTGYLVRYAIADVAAFVTPAGPMDIEAHVRGQTLYAPDGNARLYPPTVSESAGSLLPDEVRPALVWEMELDATGEGTSVHVRRALVRSRAKLDYASVQRSLDAGTAEEPLQLLREVGRLRQIREERRGGIDLPIPDQVVEQGSDGYLLTFRALLPVEGWNAQISLLTGMAAANLMLEAGIGLLRTLPVADERDVARLRRTATALGVEWATTVPYPEFIRTLDATRSEQAAVLSESTVLLRGASYVAFDGEAPANAEHSGVASTYAHATAPLRRLADRYVGEVCLAITADMSVPDWVRAALPGLPETMAKSSRRAQQYGGGIISTVEAAVLEPSVGRIFDAVVIDVDEDDDAGTVQLQEPAVTARCEGKNLPLGERVVVRLDEADVAKRRVRFALAS